jgi:hypothetical protein
MPAPLAHLWVLDLMDLRGALAGRLLAGLGAGTRRMSRTALIAAGPALLLGADTEGVLTYILGPDRTEVQRLIEEGVCR